MKGKCPECGGGIRVVKTSKNKYIWKCGVLDETKLDGEGKPTVKKDGDDPNCKAWGNAKAPQAGSTSGEQKPEVKKPQAVAAAAAGGGASSSGGGSAGGGNGGNASGEQRRDRRSSDRGDSGGILDGVKKFLDEL